MLGRVRGKTKALSFHFKRSEAIPEGVKRLVLEELDRALEFVSDPVQPLDYRVHEARKCLKRLRALFALLDGSVASDALDDQREHVRGAAHALAELRGRAALHQTLLGLFERYPDALSPETVGELVRALDAGTSESADAVPEALGTATQALNRARDGAARLHISGKGFAAIEHGFQRTYARARKELGRAEKSRGVEHLHEFRTHEKRHLYHLQLFEKAWPKLVRLECKELDRLGEHLCEHHDLSLLLPLLKERALSPLDELEPLIDRRRRDLEAKIVARAARLFTETPKSRTRRFAGYHAALRLASKKTKA